MKYALSKVLKSDIIMKMVVFYQTVYPPSSYENLDIAHSLFSNDVQWVKKYLKKPER